MGDLTCPDGHANYKTKKETEYVWVCECDKCNKDTRMQVDVYVCSYFFCIAFTNLLEMSVWGHKGEFDKNAPVQAVL